MSDNNVSHNDPDGWSEQADVLSAHHLREQYPNYDDQIKETTTQAQRDASTTDAASVVGSAIAERLEHDLYDHQSAAIEHLLEGRNVSVATSTSSGKTYVYALYFALLKQRNPTATALFLYPTKALSRDQEQALNALYRKLDVDITVDVYDGDTPPDQRKRIRNQADIIISNFAGINAYLAHHVKWRSIFANCSLLAVDEAHTYTGIHGMHVGWTIRRLRRILAYYGSDPQFVCTTATIGNPAEHARRLTGKECYVVDDDGSGHGRRKIVFWDPPLDEDDIGDEYDLEEYLAAKRNATTEASEVLAHLGLHDIQTLMFTRSRQGAERATKQARWSAGDHPTGGHLSVEPYHAGHNKQSRRGTEHQLKSEQLDGVISTNALELGIDIGSVDATIVTGYPGTRQSFWQQVGRAGRGQADSLAILVARTDAIDQYIFNHPEYLLDDDMEDAVLDLKNNVVYARHLLCAANERPLTYDDGKWFGSRDRLERAVTMWKDAGKLVGDLNRGVQYNGPPRPQSNISMYATSDEQFTVQCENGEIDMEPIDRDRAYREFHPGALMLHDGTEYEVVDFEENVPRPYITVQQVTTNEYTQTLSNKTISNLHLQEVHDLGGGYRLCFGMGTVSIHYSHYRRIEIHTGRTKGSLQPTNLPPLDLRTQLMWVETPQELFERTIAQLPEDVLGDPPEESAIGANEWTFLGGLHGAEHAMIKMAPLELRMDKSDLGGLSTMNHPETNRPTWFIHDTVNGGIGFSRGIFEHAKAVMEMTVEQVDTCGCSGINGCPACLMDTQCGNQNEPLHSPATIFILNTTLSQFG